MAVIGMQEYAVNRCLERLEELKKLEARVIILEITEKKLGDVLFDMFGEHDKDLEDTQKMFDESSDRLEMISEVSQIIKFLHHKAKEEGWWKELSSLPYSK